MAGSAQADQTMAGTACVDITPPLTVPHLGYCRQRHAFFTGVHDPLQARALVVDDGATRVAIISADSIGFSRRILGPGRDFVDEVRERIEQLTGIPSDHILLGATHAHSVPETIGFRPLWEHPGVAEWLEVLIDKLATVVALADRDRQPVRLKLAQGSAEGIGWSRRLIDKDGRVCHYPSRPPDDQIADWGRCDHAVTVLALETLNGEARKALVHFTCHPTTVQVNPLVSADYPGVAMRFVENAGVDCSHAMFLQGASGSINPVRDTTDFDDVRRYGQALAGEVIKLLALSSAPAQPCLPAQVAVKTTTVTLPSRDLPDPEQLRQAQEEQRRLAREASDPQERQKAQESVLVLEEQIARVELGTGPFVAQLQGIRLGNLILVGLPAEPFAELGLAVRAMARGGMTAVCVGYANGYLGYVAPPKAWEQGGYELGLGMWSLVGPGAFEALLAGARELVEGLSA
jgi:neutral ceramidase